MKYLTFLLFLLGGFLSRAEGQTIQDYNTYISELLTSGDPYQVGEAERIQNFTTGLYPTAYFNPDGIKIEGGKRCKKLVAMVEGLDQQGYDDESLLPVEVIIVLVRREEAIPTGQISEVLKSKMPNLKNIIIISEFPSVPEQFTSILPPISTGFVALHKVSLTQ